MAFEDCVAFVLKWEGGLNNDINDPGGTTKFGISQRAYPHLDIPNITRDDAVSIYYHDYWKKAGCDSLKPDMALCVFNAAVNCGASRALKWLTDSSGNWREYLYCQMVYYASLKNRLYFSGWMNRTLDAWRYAKKLEVPNGVGIPQGADLPGGGDRSGLDSP